MSIHLDDELPALLAGELSRDATLALAAHLDECEPCRQSLAEVAIAHGALAAARRVEHELFDTNASPLAEVEHDEVQPALRFSPRAERRRHRLLGAAAVVIVLGGGAISWSLTHQATSGDGPVAAIADLHRLDGPVSAVGHVTVHDRGTLQEMDVTISGLPAAGANRYYEIWLLQPSTNKMMPIGVVPESGTADYVVSSSIMSQYSAIDVSLQENDGDPAHSNVSVLRGIVTGV